MRQLITTFGLKTTLVETSDFDSLAADLAREQGQSVFFCNVHMLMLAQEDTSLANAMVNADVVFADGVPIAWLQNRISGKDAQVIRGYEMMLAICKRAAEKGEKVGVMGSTQDVMNALSARMREQFGGLQIAYQYCPPFVEGEMVSTQPDLHAITNSGIKWLFVGLGCPKQEKWIAKYKDNLECNILGVGAAFDWLSGQQSKPPEWMEKFAVAWLYRLLQNPFRMLHRYVKYNTKFLLKVFKLTILGK